MIVGANNTNITTMNSNDDEISMFLKKIQEIERRRTEDRFNAAYKVISGKKLESLERVTKIINGNTTRATVRQGIAIVEQKKLVNAGKFRYAFIETMSLGDLQYF